EPKEDDLLKRKFSRPNKYLVDGLMLRRMITMSLPMMIGTLLLFGSIYKHDTMKAMTVSLVTLAVFQWFNAWNCRSEEKSIFQMNPFSNKFLVGATIIIISLQFFAMYNGFMSRVLSLSPLSTAEWGIIVAISSSIIVFEEVRKFFVRLKKRSV
ncbi:MAG: cation-translocating P-type ATPase C-terminal domain-containing protein, partial [Patescibacteria group bacterium]